MVGDGIPFRLFLNLLLSKEKVPYTFVRSLNLENSLFFQTVRNHSWGCSWSWGPGSLEALPGFFQWVSSWIWQEEPPIKPLSSQIQEEPQWGPLPCKQGVCHTVVLPFTFKYLKAKEDLWKLKYFTMPNI